jgi:aminopeptidase N
MLKLLPSTILGLTLLFVATTGQKVKLYEDFDPTSTVSRFGDEKQGISYRLPNNTIPLRYDISLSTRIDLNDFNFNGNVKIRLQAREVTNTITIHSKQLMITSMTLTPEVGATIALTHVLEPVTEFLIITTNTPLSANFIYTLDISYTGSLRTGGAGFYRTSYTNQQGVVRYVGAKELKSIGI